MRPHSRAPERLGALETRIGELERQREDAARAVERLYREMLELREAVDSAKDAVRCESGERALRRRAEAIRAAVQRIECDFTATGRTGGVIMRHETAGGKGRGWSPGAQTSCL